ncbi:hypothetical protein AVEN_148332-1 [Araneus ventricosus]|uniref:Tc1-like transposase DDE domain-containing protein n=1 Tax=Araneus ventricosus TaxID=182803 RepID=A0A4Y2NJM2_ARAVE|nr:hypothetical protein AVEN_148332-1 [Araneus ventricosus]
MVINAKNRTVKMHICFQLRNVWFQHDGAPAHKTSLVKQYLVEEFGEQTIEYGGFQEWLPRSPDLTPMDFFPMGIPQTAGVCEPFANTAGTFFACDVIVPV